MAAESDRRVWSQTPGRRIDDWRGTAFDFKGEPRPLAGDADADAVATEGAAAWGAAVEVLGYDKVHLLIDHTEGTDTTGIEIRAQISQHGGSSTSPWYDFYVRPDPSGAPGRWAVSLATIVALQAGMSEPVGGRFMRFKAWVPGADQTDSRVLVSGIFDKNSV